jgi:hypothetical protein
MIIAAEALPGLRDNMNARRAGNGLPLFFYHSQGRRVISFSVCPLRHDGHAGKKRMGGVFELCLFDSGPRITASSDAIPFPGHKIILD